MAKLPVGVQDFPTLIRDGFLYIDKTELMFRLATEGVSCFLARPRRFGKSLLLSTLGAFFRGERELFAGTWLETCHYDWPQYPVVRLDFSRLLTESPETLLASLNAYVHTVAAELGPSLARHGHPSDTLAELVTSLSQKARVVLLIDEYDFPITKHIGDHHLTEANRQALQSVFTVVKSLQDKLRFVFITGVSKFSKVSLFSAMNSLDDISLDPNYATLVGITEHELRTALAAPLASAARQRGMEVDQFVDRMRQWYNGYLFTHYPTEESRVYNPWSVLRSLKTGVLDNYWFDTGTPTFAVNLIKDRSFPIIDLEAGVTAGSNLNMSSDPAELDIATLLYQTGYLTIDRYDEASYLFHLKVPNEEVRRSMINHLFSSYAGQETWQAGKFIEEMRTALSKGDMAAFFNIFNTLLASIPYPLHIKQESYYHSLIYLCVRLLGFSVRAEVATSRGRVDLVVEQDNDLYLFEFKINSSAHEALVQIEENDYAARFAHDGRKIRKIGASFDTSTRRISDWKETS